MFAPARKSPERLSLVERLTEWTRERFKLPGEGAISVSEIACPLPGCPPLETVVTFWIANQSYRFKVFKPLTEVGPDDVPYAWLKEALAVGEDYDCGCC
jgi:nitrate reductase delta subunit